MSILLITCTMASMHDKSSKRNNDISIKPTCSYCDFCYDDGVCSLNLSETWPSSSCPGCGIVIAVCPYFCCDAA